MEDREQVPLFELMHRERYTPEELALLLEVPVETIYGAAFRKELTARIVDHEVIEIHRADALIWLSRDRTGRGESSLA